MPLPACGDMPSARCRVSATTTGTADITGRMADEYNAIMDGVRQRLGDERYAELSARGRAMTWIEMVAYALSLPLEGADGAEDA